MASVSGGVLERLAGEFGLDFPPVVRALSQMTEEERAAFTEAHG